METCGTCKFFNRLSNTCTSNHPTYGGNETKADEERCCAKHTIITEQDTVKKICKNCKYCYTKSQEGKDKNLTHFCHSDSGSIVAGIDIPLKLMETGCSCFKLPC